MSIQSIPSSAPNLVPAPMARPDGPASPTSVAGPSGQQSAEPSIGLAAPNQIQQALNDVRMALAPVAQNLLFSVDDDTGRTVIKIIDSATDEVIKQIPSEEILAIAKALDKLQGLLIKQEA